MCFSCVVCVSYWLLQSVPCPTDLRGSKWRYLLYILYWFHWLPSLMERSASGKENIFSLPYGRASEVAIWFRFQAHSTEAVIQPAKQKNWRWLELYSITLWIKSEGKEKERETNATLVLLAVISAFHLLCPVSQNAIGSFRSKFDKLPDTKELNSINGSFFQVVSSLSHH